MRGITETVKHLLILNVIVYLGANFIGNGETFYRLLALYYPKSDLFEPWQIITHMFMHASFNSGVGIMHILFNMFALWMFGTAVEQVLEAKKFLFFYISAGLGAVLLTFAVYFFQIYPDLSQVSSIGLPSELVDKIINLDIVNNNRFEGKILYEKMQPLLAEYNVDASRIDNTSFKSFFDLNVNTAGSMVGASGAIMGVLVAFGMMFPESKLMLIFLPIPIKAKYFIPGIILLDLISAVTGQSFFSPANTAYVAHIGGALTGFLLMWYWKKTQFKNNRWY